MGCSKNYIMYWGGFYDVDYNIRLCKSVHKLYKKSFYFLCKLTHYFPLQQNILFFIICFYTFSTFHLYINYSVTSVSDVSDSLTSLSSNKASNSFCPIFSFFIRSSALLYNTSLCSSIICLALA